MKYFKITSPFINLLLVFIFVNVILRLVLLFHPITQSSFGWIELVKIFSFGFVSDVLLFIVGSLFLWLYLLFLSDSKYDKPLGFIVFGSLILLLLYISFGNTILNEYGSAVPKIAIIFLSLKTLFFGLILFLPQYRKSIRTLLYTSTIFIFVLIIIQNAVSEFFFWNEFGVRYNFIAVDYLVYTNTVIGNIMESYPVIPLFVGVGLITALFTYFILVHTKPFLLQLPTFTDKIKGFGLYIISFMIALYTLPMMADKEKSANVFTSELQANGIYKFYVAFKNSELDFETFYKTIPMDEAFKILQKNLQGISKFNASHTIKSDKIEIHKNVVLITIESLSADFMTEFGNEKKLTPFLDTLAQQSLQFTNLYAVGNRTVRGLEAVTLCLPPSAAESIIKKSDNKNKFSTARVFKKKGYAVKFMYGGDAYFDNMQDFFGGNGYDIIDKKSFQSNEITFENIWGVCDEDMYVKAIKVMNEEAKQNRPFFNHIMTVSNHRPFTYPEGKIDISSQSKSRDGGVKYTDYALQRFFMMAKRQNWYKNTVFVILADHCASSSGKTELPLEKYRVPAMIYSPGFIAPQNYDVLMSQIDVMPTVFGLLKFNNQSKFFGENVFHKNYQPRAFVATYQDLGLLKDNTLTIISPIKQVKQFELQRIIVPKVKSVFQSHYNEKPIKKLREDLVKETISYYQTAAYLLKNKKLNY